MKSLLILISVLVLIAASGCSTIVNGKVQTVSINSNVTGAKVMVNGVQVGETPFTGSLIRSNKTVVTVSKEGYESKTITLDTAIEPIFWGNIIIGGVIGSTTDAATGSMYKYAPGTLEVDLAKK